MDNAVNTETPNVDIVEQAQARVDTAKQAVTNLTDQLKIAKQTAVDYKAALKALPEGDENIPTGEQAVAQAEQAVQTLTASLATAKEEHKAAKEGVKVARAEKREAAKAAKAAEKAAKEAEKANRVEQNGMVAPAEGTISKTLWDTFDEVSREKGAPAAFSEVLEPAKAKGVVEGSIRAGYAHWRKFHGLTGRIMSAADIEAAKEKEAEKARKAEEREAKKAEREAEKQRKAEEKAAKEAQAKAEAEAKAAAEAAAE